ncbi:PIN-like domain-containing protein [Streptomyces lavendulocolor]|uniref:PIN-like domain-containing protein n=1 Tax=Streptomyces lavendulocolor TaxID=67316 RepID=UPI003C2F4DC2
MSTFRSGFQGLWRRPIDDYKKAVREYLICVDTNVLLELYRFTPEARGELLNVLKKFEDRLWIPHQVASEYHSRRVDAVKEHLDLYKSIPAKLEEYQRKATQELLSFAKRCSMSEQERKKLTSPLEGAFKVTLREIAKHREAFDLTLEGVITKDPILDTLAITLDGKVGDGFTQDEIADMISTFEKRCTEQTPPGFKDARKDENAHGDFFVWEQILRKAESDSTPVLFVTNDVKDDWVRREAGLIVGARPELLAEFAKRSGKDFLLTQLGRFLQIAKEELGAAISPSTMAQAENLQASTKRTQTVRVPPELHDLLLTELLKRVDWAELKSSRATGMEREVYERSHRRATRLLRQFNEATVTHAGEYVEIEITMEDMPLFQKLISATRRQSAVQPTSDTSPSGVAKVWAHLSTLEERLQSARERATQIQIELGDAEHTVVSLSNSIDDGVKRVLERAVRSTEEQHRRSVHEVMRLEQEIARVRSILHQRPDPEEVDGGRERPSLELGVHPIDVEDI